MVAGAGVAYSINVGVCITYKNLVKLVNLVETLISLIKATAKAGGNSSSIVIS